MGQSDPRSIQPFVHYKNQLLNVHTIYEYKFKAAENAEAFQRLQSPLKPEQLWLYLLTAINTPAAWHSTA